MDAHGGDMDDELKRVLLLSLQDVYIRDKSGDKNLDSSNPYGAYGSEEEAIKQLQFLSAIESAENEPRSFSEFIESNSLSSSPGTGLGHGHGHGHDHGQGQGAPGTGQGSFATWTVPESTESRMLQGATIPSTSSLFSPSTTTTPPTTTTTTPPTTSAGDFAAWKSKTAAERSCEIFGKGQAIPKYRNSTRDDVSLAQHQVARQNPKIQKNELTADTKPARPLSGGFAPVGASYVAGREDGRPKSNPLLETLIPNPSSGATSNNKTQQQLYEDAEFKLALELSKMETKMDFESKTQLALTQSTKIDQNENLLENLQFNRSQILLSDDEGMTKVLRRRHRSGNSLSRTATPTLTPNTDSSGSPVDNSSGFFISQSLSTYTPEEYPIIPGSPRIIVVDGNNVGWAHSGHTEFSLKGVTICIDFFQKRGHQVAVFLPRGAFSYASPEEKDTLRIMELGKILVYCPPKTYDDLFSIKYAASRKGIVVSNDQFKDVKAKNIPDYTDQVEKRRLGFSFHDDTFMVPDDPLGRDGPSLQQFLMHPLI